MEELAIAYNSTVPQIKECIDFTGSVVGSKPEEVLYFLLIKEYGFTDFFRKASSDSSLEKILFDINLRPLPIKQKIAGKPLVLYPHQINAINFMKKRENLKPGTHWGLRGGIISMEMGLGKSLTAATLSLISPRPPRKSKHGQDGFPTLIIASKAVMAEWKTQCFDLFFGDKVKVLYFHPDYTDKDAIESMTREELIKYDFVVTTYDMCVRTAKVHSFLKRVKFDNDAVIYQCTRKESDKPTQTGSAILFCTPWERIICDESQKFANFKTKMYMSMMAMYGEFKWCLTGTPIRNYSTDIWAQFRFVGYNEIEHHNRWKFEYSKHMKTLRRALQTLSYKEAGIELPPKNMNIVRVNFGKTEHAIYGIYYEKLMTAFRKYITHDAAFMCVLAWFTRLRQVCVSSYILTPQSKRNKKPSDDEALEELLATDEMSKWILDKDGESGIGSCKIKATIKIIKEMAKGEKILIFSMFVSALDLVAYALDENLPDMEYALLVGSTKQEDRVEILKRFREGKIPILLMNYKVGSEGLNLTQANNVVLLEPWWTDAVHNQAIARAWRINQLKAVNVFILTIEGTIETKILEICEQKMEMSKSILLGEKFKKTAGLDFQTLEKILRRPLRTTAKKPVDELIYNALKGRELKAVTIAKNINVGKSIVNRILYAEQERANPRWRKIPDGSFKWELIT